MLEKFLNAAREEGLLPYGMELRMDDIVAESWEQTPEHPQSAAAASSAAHPPAFLDFILFTPVSRPFFR